MAGRLRITGGALARRQFDVPPAADQGLVRPTSDKVRAALFSSLGGVCEGARVLDLYAGSGALGLEALSRGARAVCFVEHDRRTARVIEENVRALGVAERAEVVVGDVRTRAAPLGKFDLVLCDPPYKLAVDAALFRSWADALGDGGTLVIERDADDADVPARINDGASGLSLVRQRLYGDTRVFVLQRAAPHGAHSGSSMARTAIYPGSFDPLTNGHLDIIARGSRTFDHVIVAVANNVQKAHLFSIDERLALTRQAVAHLGNIEVDTFDGLVVEYAKTKGVHTLLRGLRAVSDFEYELQLASMNRRLQADVETVFMMTSEELFYVSSRLVREVASFGGDISSFVPAPIAAALSHKLAQAKPRPGGR